jgi:hypothetical protein
MSYQQNGTGNVVFIDRRLNDRIENRQTRRFDFLGGSQGCHA